ncbi:MAG: GIY-YIG nuclease family protein [Sulfolobales archaeon]
MAETTNSYRIDIYRLDRSLLENIPRDPGLYIIILSLERDICIEIGALGMVSIEPGIYGYIGSARGRGGLRSRIARHIAKDKKIRWHIDHLTSRRDVRILSIIYIRSKEDLEDAIADIVRSAICWIPSIQGFGSTDKRSYTHLFRCTCFINECMWSLLKALAENKLKPSLIVVGNISLTR